MASGIETLKLTFLDMDSATATMRLSVSATALEAILQALPKAVRREQLGFLVQSLVYSQPGVICEGLLKLQDGDAVRNAYRKLVTYPSWSMTSGADSGVLRICVRGAVDHVRNGLSVDRPIWDAGIALSFCDCLLRSLRGGTQQPELTARGFAESLVAHCRDQVLAALPAGTPSHAIYRFVDERRAQGITAAQPGIGSVSLDAVRLEDALRRAIREAAPAGKGVQNPMMLAGSLYRNSPNVRAFFGELGIGEHMSLVAGKQAAVQQQPAAKPSPEGAEPAIETLLVDLTQQAREGKLPPCIGRDREVDQVITVLVRKTKSNPVLTGEAGVGKTAVVEALAQRIAAGDCPEALRKSRILSVSVNTLVAGTIYRGQFEAQMNKLLELARKDGVFLFIDEIHTIVGAGQCAGGSLDAGNALKPALGRGGIRLIGATTTSEYRHIMADPALERRFQPIVVLEPSLQAMTVIMNGLVATYAEPRGVAVPPEIRSRILELASSHLPAHFFPAKGLDVLDEAATRALRQGLHDLPSGVVEQVVADFAGIPVAKVRMSRHERIVQALASVGGQQYPQMAETCRRLALYLAGSALSRRPDRPVSFVCQGGHLARQAAEAVCNELALGSTLLIDGETIVPPANSGKAADKAQGWSGMVGESRAVLINLDTLPPAATGILTQALRGRFPGADALYCFFQEKTSTSSGERRIGFGVDDTGLLGSNPKAALIAEVDGTFDFGAEDESVPEAKLDDYIGGLIKTHALRPDEEPDLAAHLRRAPAGQQRIEAAIWLAERSLQRSTVQATTGVPLHPVHSDVAPSSTAAVGKVMTEDKRTAAIEEVFAYLAGEDQPPAAAPVAELESATSAAMSSAQPQVRDDEDLVLALRRVGVESQFKSILHTLSGKVVAFLVPMTVGKILSTDLTTFRPPSFGPGKRQKLSDLQAWLRTHRVESALPDAQATMPTEESGKAA